LADIFCLYNARNLSTIDFGHVLMTVDFDHFRQLIALGSLRGGEPRESEYTGTKALMLAVLEDGIRNGCGRAGPLRTEAEDWIHSNERWPFSILVICETLGLQPDAVRRALAGQSQILPRRIRANARRQQPAARK
jgi:hypothetical protein